MFHLELSPHPIKLIILSRITQWYLIHSEYYTSTFIEFQIFSSPQKGNPAYMK